MEYLKITIHTQSDDIERLTDTLIEAGFTGFEVQDSADFEAFLAGAAPHWDYVDDALLKLRDAESTVTLYLDHPSDETLVRAAAGDRKITVQTVDDSAWTDTWKQYYHPIEISDRLAVVPEWENFEPRAGQNVLKLDPGAAFGTGSHETTAMCLTFLSELDWNDKTVLDVGCGSGILAIAALLLGAKRAAGVDIDELAVKASRDNAKRNRVNMRAAFKQGEVCQIAGQFDVVIANIVADVILSILDELSVRMRPDGVLLLSGIIDTRVPDIERALKARGFVWTHAAQTSWNAYLCRKERV